MDIIWKGSPNFTPGREFFRPLFIVIHIMDGSLVGTDAHFSNPSTKVSAHYGVGKTGEIHQYVKEEDTAYHAGVVYKPNNPFFSKENPNKYTIGIEHEGRPTDQWSAAMKKASAFLIAKCCHRWDLPINRKIIIGHYEINGHKPNCPANEKNIINELVLLANEQAKLIDRDLVKATGYIQAGLEILNKYYGKA